MLPVRNLGNTIDPIGGSYRITGPTARSGTSRRSRRAGQAHRLAPGPTSGLKKGRYTINATVTQGGRNVNARTSFTIR